mgnify:CR=1 FL=1
MKKYLILAVVTLLAVALSACSGNVKSNDTSAENTTTQVSTSVNETVQTTNAELPKIYNPTNVEIRDNEDENKVIIESSQIEYVCLLDDINGMVLSMKLTADGTDKFADYTKNNIGSAVRFVINGKTVSNPYINVEITDGNINFTGDYTNEEYAAIFSEIKRQIKQILLILRFIVGGVFLFPFVHMTVLVCIVFIVQTLLGGI